MRSKTPNTRGLIPSIGRPFFRRFVDRHLVPPPGDLTALPLTHGTKALLLRDILATGQLTLPHEPSRFLRQRLIFTFYGRPSYRVNPNAGGLKRSAGAPTYILIKPKAFAFAAATHPLDTGAFSLSLYEANIERALNPADFGFDPTLDDVKKIVFYFFGDNSSYVRNTPRLGLNVPDGNDEAQAYYDVISEHHMETLDERGSSIEVALSKPIEISVEWIECIVMPDLLVDAEDYGRILRDLQINVRTYRFTRGHRPSDYISRIFDVVLDYYREKRIL